MIFFPKGEKEPLYDIQSGSKVVQKNTFDKRIRGVGHDTICHF
jgi:hypothetical protein